ncbi:MAG: cyclic nucleotide-binding domain-containing protein [Candidatus Lindowbacteria bacterium]|nr:cyclic nucleotide-binding domain-containing protein [Candidatus Lindowbacteria bacterium]
MAELGPGEIFGEMAMFEKHTRSAHALAKEHSQVLVMSEEVLDKLLEKKIPKRFLANVIGVLCHRLRVTNNMYMRAKYGDKLSKDVKWLG